MSNIPFKVKGEGVDQDYWRELRYQKNLEAYSPYTVKFCEILFQECGQKVCAEGCQILQMAKRDTLAYHYELFPGKLCKCGYYAEPKCKNVNIYGKFCMCKHCGRLLYIARLTLPKPDGRRKGSKDSYKRSYKEGTTRPNRTCMPKYPMPERLVTITKNDIIVNIVR